MLLHHLFEELDLDFRLYAFYLYIAFLASAGDVVLLKSLIQRPASYLALSFKPVMYRPFHFLVLLWCFAPRVISQQQCYFGPGAVNRGPTNLVPCLGSGNSACCLLGDICLSGNTCWNYETGDLYQYGCTDINYKDSTCPFKCGFNVSMYNCSLNGIKLGNSHRELTQTQLPRHGRHWSTVAIYLE